jgi:NAD(P)-dependent dehydrogenase (short-subunit alcohol dehydrogenase family)
MTPRVCEGRVAIVTGAAHGLGRSYAVALAGAGAAVVVNDLDGDAAQEVADGIEAAGGRARASTANVCDWESARSLVQTAIEAFGQLDVLVGNAGILRDRTIVSMSEREWDDVIAVHLKGTIAPIRWAAEHWRERSKSGEPVAGRIVTTTSASGLYGNPGQANYVAAKAGVTMLTRTAAAELGRYGVTANAIAPAALTAMTEPWYASLEEAAKARLDPAWVAAFVVWLATTDSADVSGYAFEISGNGIAIADGWRRGPLAEAQRDPMAVGATARRLAAAQPLGPLVHELVAADGARA